MENIKKEYVIVGNKRNCKPFKMCYSLFGNGETKVIFVMGSLLSYTFSLSYISEYMKHPEKYTVCLYDHCGIGDTGYSFFSSYKELAMDMIDLLNHLKWDSTHIIGLSSGCAVALELSEMEPNLIKSLNLLSLPPFEFNKGCRQFLALPIYSRLHNIKKTEMFTRLIFSDSYLNAPSKINPTGLNKDFIMPLVSAIHDTRYKLKYMTRFSHIYSVITHKLKPMYVDVTKRPFPIVMFFGSDDPIMPNPTKFINMIKPNLIYICKNAGHCLNTEDPELFDRLSMEFIDSANSFKPESNNENDEKNQFFVTKYLNFNVDNIVPTSNNPFPLKNVMFNLLRPKL